ncbi:Translation elongation/initiation factor/Ribosomal beta-barrel [Penicillium coprophilum]|uniref:Translation elongation/initiation factor/Ribosomal beta-barrel n=1 Tax=Penicillium coprophilum TaxID=36646 RepID=UPI0023822CA9|nr:Translation elongation/initiation factor/Ribosomal beta-barrel [Penicillium coprophilum]KAJ5164174.1 Translation elongation/initiation factor/Ribosomal beta-barrel [Penicillium coprophilum]
MAVPPADANHYQSKDEEAAFSTMNDHVEHASPPMEHSNKKNAPTVIGDDPNHPVNWPKYKRNINLGLISFHALVTNFVGAGIIPVYATLAEKFGIEIQDVSYLTSIHILCTGLTPFFLVPLSTRYGRRPVWLISTLFTAVCNVGCAESQSYAPMLVCRILGSLMLGAPIALGPPVVMETFAEHERGIALGTWSVFVTLGPLTGPFVMGFVAERLGWQWIYWIFTLISGAQFLLYFLFSPETRYIRQEKTTSKSGFMNLITFSRIDPTPFFISEVIRPFSMGKQMTVLLPVLSHSMIFCLSAAMLTVEIPQLFATRFELGPEQTGIQFLGIIVGTILGELFNAVVLSLMNRKTAEKQRHAVNPKNYLVASYLGFVSMIVGLVVFCVLLGNTLPMHYKVSPIIGIGIAGFGNQLVSNFLINYIMHVHSNNAATASIFLGFIRQTWCFIGPFWFPAMFETVGITNCAGLLSALVVISVLPVIWLHWRSQS